jgi:hypothetical protein
MTSTGATPLAGQPDALFLALAVPSGEHHDGVGPARLVGRWEHEQGERQRHQRGRDHDHDHDDQRAQQAPPAHQSRSLRAV